MEPSLVILAGGISSRMKRPAPSKDATDRRLLREADLKPKGMIGLGREGRPFLDYLLFNGREAGYRDVVLVVGEDSEDFRSYYGMNDRDNAFAGMKVSYAVQKIPAGRSKPLGTADAVLCAMLARPDWRGTKFTVCNSDNLYSQRVLSMLRESPAECALIDYDLRALGVEPARVSQFAVLQVDAHNRLTNIIEKPSPDQIGALTGPDGRIGVSMNIFRFSYDSIFQPLRDVPPNPVRQEKEIPPALMLLVDQRPGSVVTIPVAEEVPDLTEKADIVRVQHYLKQHYPEFTL